MANVVIQMGHVPRRRDSTGAHREQEFAREVAARLGDRLDHLGHQVEILDAVTGDGATSKVPDRADVFVSLHIDGHKTRRGGACVGYPPGSDTTLARAWKREHARIYPQIPDGHNPERDGWPDPEKHPGLWVPDNYTRNLSGYYMWRRTGHIRHRFLAEHGTSRHDLDWLFAHLDDCAEAHVRAIGTVLGHPDQEDADMAYLFRVGDDSAVWVTNDLLVRVVDKDEFGRLKGRYGEPVVVQASEVEHIPLVGPDYGRGYFKTSLTAG